MFIIKAACILHNFIRIKQEIFFLLKQWTYNNKTIKFKLKNHKGQVRSPLKILQNKENLCEYFMTPPCSIPYQ